MATTAQEEAALEDLKQIALDALDPIYDRFSPSDTRWMRGALADTYGATPDQVQEFEDAMLEGRFDDARELLAQLSQVEEAAASGGLKNFYQIITGNEIAYLENLLRSAIKDNASTEDIQGLIDQIRAITQQYREDAGQGDPNFDSLWPEDTNQKFFAPVFEALNDVEDAIAARDAIEPGGADDESGTGTPENPGGFPVGPGQGWVVFDPSLPPGAIWSLGEGVLLYGSGGDCGCVSLMYGPAALVGLPIPTVEPLPNVSGDGQWTERRIVLVNPSDSGGDVHFVLADHSGELVAGDTQEYPVASSVIQFDRGGDFGDAKYRLVTGSYKFVATDHGWELYRTSFQATLDNTANGQEFYLVAGDQQVTVPAGEEYELESNFPMMVAFHTGVADDPATKKLADDATYTIGIDTETGGWDLFPGDAATSGAGSAADARSVAMTDNDAGAADGAQSLPQRE